MLSNFYHQIQVDLQPPCQYLVEEVGLMTLAEVELAFKHSVALWVEWVGE